VASATSRQPLSSASVWPRSPNSLSSVTACDFPYSFKIERVTLAGTVRSLPPAISSSGPRETLPGLTSAGDRGVRFAAATSNKGRPGDGTVQRSDSSSDSRSGSALPKP
jgi:hypothetical protein